VPGRRQQLDSLHAPGQLERGDHPRTEKVDGEGGKIVFLVGSWDERKGELQNSQ
jgi:hypothetical protein